jgi:hypothetical protein
VEELMRRAIHVKLAGETALRKHCLFQYVVKRENLLL